MDGASVLAAALKSQGVEFAFGVVGIPIIEVSVALQGAGVKFVAMRNEQSASYAASAVGYLTRKPAVCLVVSGPGFVHALAGLANANENCWPVLIIGGASDSQLSGSGAFQEFPQAEAAAPFCKFAARFTSIARIPFLVHKAVKVATYGRPGAVYLDLPGEFINSAAPDIEYPPPVPEAPQSQAASSSVLAAAALLSASRRPLVIVGKGAAYDGAESVVRRLVDEFRLPFLPTPMGKGVVSDGHPSCVSAARTLALRTADVLLLLGARLNWMLHFGLPPRLQRGVSVVQVDICPEEFHTNVTSGVALCGNVSTVVEQLASSLSARPPSVCADWRQQLADACDANRLRVQSLVADGQSGEMTYYSVLHEAARFASAGDWLIVSEGANTMDIGRGLLPNSLPRRRLDAGSFGTMGVGLGFGIAAELCRRRMRPPPDRVFCVEGDSAIGFSLAELEVMVRYRMPVLVLVINNSGIYAGLPPQLQQELVAGKESEELALSLPPTVLSSQFRYDLVMAAAGGVGCLATNVQQLREAFEQSLAVRDRPCLINAIIDTASERKQQEFDWLTRSKL